MFKESKKRPSNITEAREEFVEKYSQKIIEIATAMEVRKSIKKSLGGKEPDPMTKKIMEEQKEVIDSATDEDKKKAEEFIETRDKEF